MPSRNPRIDPYATDRQIDIYQRNEAERGGESAPDEGLDVQTVQVTDYALASGQQVFECEIVRPTNPEQVGVPLTWEGTGTILLVGNLSTTTPTSDQATDSYDAKVYLAVKAGDRWVMQT
jgi:hypothetical protein